MPAVRAAAAAALAQMGGAPALEELFRPARDPHPMVRAALARALAGHLSADGIPLLNRLRRDADPDVRSAAVLTRDGAAAEPSDEQQLVDRILHARTPVERLHAAGDWLARHDAGRRPLALTFTAAR